MSGRRGWVSAEVAPGTWRRLAVFDDGWVELPGFARELSDTRRNLRESLITLGAFAAATASAVALGAVGAPGVLVALCLLVGVGALARGLVQGTRTTMRSMTQTAGDVAQARAEHDAGRRLRVAPGAPRWRRATSAAQLAAWLDGAALVAAVDVLAVQSGADPAGPGSYRAVVVCRDGTTRTYTSPDATLVRLLSAFGSGHEG